MKYLVLLLLGALSALYTQCGKPFATKGDLIYSVDGVFVPVAGADVETSLRAFEETVYPITRQRCASCHASGQQPEHASTSVTTAHNSLLAQYKINFTNPASSRMVAKLRDENHNCWGSCAAAATEMQRAIEQWAQRLERAGAEVPGTNDDFTLVTAQSRPIAAERQLVTDGTTRYQAQAFAAMLTAPMIRATSTQTYVTVPPNGMNRTLADNAADAGIASFTFSATAAATNGALWGLVKAEAPNEDSFHVRLNTGNFVDWQIPATGGEFRWVRVTTGANRTSVNYNVLAGTNTVTVRERKDGTQLATLMWVNDQNFVPAGLGTAGRINLVFPLDQLLAGAPVSSVSQSSQEAFRDTVYALTRQRCVNCHDDQRPRHASPNLALAHDETLARPAVNLANPSASLLVTKLQQRHNCWSGNCASDAQQMLAAVQSWGARLSGQNAGVRIEVMLEDYDAFSYRLSNLRLVTSGAPVYIKNIRVLVNNQYNPQHSNFTYVDQVVMPGTSGELLPSSMIILKDRGEANDRISLAFEVLELR